VLVDVDEAKTRLSELVERAATGEEIMIGQAGRPVVRLVPYVEDRQPREPGLLKGQLWVADDFDRTAAGVVDGFESIQ
jgi:prevent-host-death family protein